MAKDRTKDALRKLLQGELSAIETYEQVLSKMKGEPEVSELIEIASDHRDVADSLTRKMLESGGEPPSNSGPWGAWASAVTGTAKMFGDAAALKTLKEGEEHGIKQYQEVSKDDHLDPELRQFVAGDLLPRQKRHISVLDRLMHQ